MFNKSILVGNITRDIELRYSQNGSAIAKTAIATSRKFTLNGEKKEETCFIDITFFGRSAEIANQYLRKGSKILVDGRLSFEQWVDQTNGQKRSKHYVIVETMQMLDSRDNSSGYSDSSSGYSDSSSGYSDSSSGYSDSSSGYSDSSSGYNRLPENNLPDIDIDEEIIPF